MKKVLRLTIQVSWAGLGLFCCFTVAQLLWDAVSGRILNGAFFREGFVWEISGASALLIGLFLLGALIYTAWQAVFRFSSIIVGPTVFIVSLLLLAAANESRLFQIVALHGPRVGILPDLLLILSGLVLASVVLVGPFAYYRVMKPLLTDVLFPTQRRSGARMM